MRTQSLDPTMFYNNDSTPEKSEWSHPYPQLFLYSIYLRGFATYSANHRKGTKGERERGEGTTAEEAAKESET